MAPKKPPVGKSPADAGAAGAGGAAAAVAFVRPQYAVNLVRYPSNEPFGRLVFELASDAVPKTVENFKQLSQGVTVGDKKNPKTASYKGCRFLRLTSDVLQSGDAQQRDDGKGNDSIYNSATNGSLFDDEAFGVYTHKLGVLSMCNSGPNTNGSQFFICRSTCPYLDAKCVSFGALVEGEDVLRALIEELEPFTDTAVLLQQQQQGVVEQQGGVVGGDHALSVDTSATWGKLDSMAPIRIGSIVPL